MAAFLTPDRTRREGGLVISEKLIPDTALWPRDVRAGGFLYKKGTPYKANRLLSGGTGCVQGVTVHNTSRIRVPEDTTPAEQYTRATWPNANMGSVRVHYYVDGRSVWQNLRENEVGWHAADGRGPGNETTLAVEIIMAGTGDREDLDAEENGARLCGLLLARHGLTAAALYRHRDWYPRKNCPCYLIPHWDEFKARVEHYRLAALGEAPAPQDKRLTALADRLEAVAKELRTIA